MQRSSHQKSESIDMLCVTEMTENSIKRATSQTHTHVRAMHEMNSPARFPQTDNDGQSSSRDGTEFEAYSSLKSKKFRSTFEVMKTQVKSELQKLSYRDKLLNVEMLIKRGRELCQEYGYFYVTCAMFQVNKSSQIKMSLWIHPDLRSRKPLHPILKSNQFNCQLEFIASLRHSLKQMFPTIDLGRGKTFATILIHLANLKKSLEQISKKQNQLTKFKETKNNPEVRSLQTTISNRAAISLRNISRMNKVYAEEYDELSSPGKISAPGNISNGSISVGNVSTGNISPQKTLSPEKSIVYEGINMSTKLQQSIRMNNSLIEKLKLTRKTSNETPEPISESKPIKRKTSRDKPAAYQQKTQSGLIKVKFEEAEKVEDNEGDAKPAAKAPERKRTEEQQKLFAELKKSIMRNSRLGNMTASIEMESQLNNLFNSTDFSLNDFYQKLSSQRPIRNSVLSRVAEQFEDLF